MKANVPREYEMTAYDFTYNKLMVDVLNKKINRADSEGKVDHKKWLEGKLRIVLAEQSKQREFMREHGIKVTELEEIDEMFVEYRVYYSNKDGGYKEGTQRIWRSWLKMHLRDRLNELLK